MDGHTRKRKFEDVLPWSFVATGVDTPFLWEEYRRGLEEKNSPPCVAENCHRCGICNGRTILLRESRSAEVRGSKNVGERDIQKKPEKKKIRLKFRKVGEMRFLSHLELAHLFYRASKRAGLSLCFSGGFHPMPRIVFATALPVGMESLSEIVDIECEGKITPPEVAERLNQNLPPGIEIAEAEEIPLFFRLSSISHPSIYWIPVGHSYSKEDMDLKIKETLDRKEFFIHQERDGKKRSVDIRGLIERMEVKEALGEEPQWGVELVVQRTGGRMAKPIEIVGAVLGLEGEPLAQLKVVKLE
jgi:radical SAM-linked protein